LAIAALAPVVAIGAVSLMREFRCAIARSQMTQERLSTVVSTVALIGVAGVWLWFMFAYAPLIFGD
jgi:hypothetical protein